MVSEPKQEVPGLTQVYTRVAASLEGLVTKIQPETIIPIGFDGAIVYHLLAYTYKKHGVVYKDQLENVVQISSKTNEMDLQKIQGVLKLRPDEVYFLDMRTKTGSLGHKIKKIATEYVEKKDINCKVHYAVLFGDKAEFSGDPNVLSDEERRKIFWVDGKEDISRFIRKEVRSWDYRFTHEAISQLKHVPEIKEIINPPKKKLLNLGKA